MPATMSMSQRVSTRAPPPFAAMASPCTLWRGGAAASVRSICFKSFATCAVFIARLRPTSCIMSRCSRHLIGSLAAAGLPVRRVNALAGLGYGFTSGTLKARCLRLVLAPAMRLLLNHANSAVLVQNPDDRAAVEALGISGDRIFVVPGSGVDTDVLNRCRSRTGRSPPRLSAGCSMTRVGTLMAAFEILARRGGTIRLLVAGERDPANPASVPQAQIEQWRQRPNVELLGHVADIRSVWSARTSRCCRRGARACRKACSKRPPAAGRLSPPTCPAAARSRATISTPFGAARRSCRSGRRHRPAGVGCGAAPALCRAAGGRWSRASFPASASARNMVALYGRLFERAPLPDYKATR